MSLGALAAQFMPMFREQAESMMTDTWKVTRASTAWSEDVGANVTTQTTIYDGPGKLQSFESYEQTPNAGGHESTVMRPTLHLPVNAASNLVTVDDVATCTASTADASLVGAVVTITGVQSKTYSTARRFPVTEVIA